MIDVLKLKVKLEGGREFEAEGPRDFLEEQIQKFYSIPPGPKELKNGSSAPPEAETAAKALWEAVSERKSGTRIALKSKLKQESSEKEAAITLLEAAQTLLNIERPTASHLTKWLRDSGYPVTRIDRILQESIKKGELLASGSRRARRYQLTPQGRRKAVQLAQELAAAISKA